MQARGIDDAQAGMMVDLDLSDPSRHAVEQNQTLTDFATYAGFPAALIARPLLEERGIIYRDAAA